MAEGLIWMALTLCAEPTGTTSGVIRFPNRSSKNYVKLRNDAAGLHRFSQ
jgi:hypothetical protein